MSNYFKVTTESKVNLFGITLFRLELTIDCKWGKAGDKGGWVESEFLPNGNARVSGNAWVSGDAHVSGNAQVSGNAHVYGNAWVYGNAHVSGNAQVYGNAWDKSPLQIQGTKHFVNFCAKGILKIGCHELKINVWLKNFKSIGEKNGYTELEIKEYGLYIELAKKLTELEK